MADHYKTLGVSPNATAKEIDKAFYKVKSKFSSEDIDDPFFKNFYRKILEAYNVLGNEKLRSQYDKNYSSGESKNSQKSDANKKTVTPIIEYFKTSKTVIDEDGKIIFSWKTSMADEVILLPTGKVAVIGSKIIHFNELDGDEVLFSLKAVNKSSGEEITEDILVEKAFKAPEIKENNLSEKKPSKNEVEERPDKALNIKSQEKKDSDGKNIKKFAIPSGVGILLIAIILFVLGKSDFWQSSSQQILEDSVSNLKEEDSKETKNNSSITEKELFAEQFQTLNGEKIAYFDPEMVLTELLSEIDKYTISNMPGYKADVRRFFNGTNNPIEWNSINGGGDELIFNSQLIVGIEQQPYSEEKDLVVEKLNFLKTGNYDTHLLKMVGFEVGDSGPPFWEPNNKWEAFQKFFKSDFDKILLTDELNRKKEIYAINQISPGFSKGYIVKSNGSILPVSFSKRTSEDEPTSIEIVLYASMNTLMESEEYLSRMQKEGRILELLELENYRDFKLVSQFYADDIERYWDDKELDQGELKTLYQTAWSNTEYSFNDVQDIKMLNERNFELITDFKYLNKEGDTISQLSSTHYTFNEKGLIEEVYEVDSDFTYQDFRNSDFDYIGQKEKIRRLLKAEDDREIDKIASFYSADMKRYWYVEDPNFIQINDIYRDAWKTSSYSQNIILNIERSAYNTYDVRVRFAFYNKKANQPETRESLTRYVFNEKGLIDEVYGLNDD